MPSSRTGRIHSFDRVLGNGHSSSSTESSARSLAVPPDVHLPSSRAATPEGNLPDNKLPDNKVPDSRARAKPGREARVREAGKARGEPGATHWEPGSVWS